MKKNLSPGDIQMYSMSSFLNKILQKLTKNLVLDFELFIFFRVDLHDHVLLLLCRLLPGSCAHIHQRCQQRRRHDDQTHRKRHQVSVGYRAATDAVRENVRPRCMVSGDICWETLQSPFW